MRQSGAPNEALEAKACSCYAVDKQICHRLMNTQRWSGPRNGSYLYSWAGHPPCIMLDQLFFLNASHAGVCRRLGSNHLQRVRVRGWRRFVATPKLTSL